MTVERTIVWVHGDDLSPNSPPLMADSGVPAVFVFDDELLREWKISLKRIVFMYECLLELPVIIRRGEVAAEVAAFAVGHGATRILTSRSPSPRLAAIAEQIAESSGGRLRVEVVERTPFVKTARKLDLKRFTYYWNAVKNDVLGSQGE
ncbi:MAG: hypothetical protein IPM16_06945 [Chloroflexi bacterium]|nr:hypothetical protein [Chloroflexota bacterium]